MHKQVEQQINLSLSLSLSLFKINKSKKNRILPGQKGGAIQGRGKGRSKGTEEKRGEQFREEKFCEVRKWEQLEMMQKGKSDQIKGELSSPNMPLDFTQ